MRNYKLDLYKGIAVIAVLWIHTGTFVSNSNIILFHYIRSITSITVPLFYIMSGYLLAKSNRVESQTLKLLKLYLIMCAITIPYILYQEMLDPSEIIPALYSLKGSGIGYLWFVRGLLIYRIAYVIIKRLTRSQLFEILNILLIIYMLLFSITIPLYVFTLCLYAPIGYLFGYYELDQLVKIKNKYMLIIPVLFLLSPYQYDPYRPVVLIATLLIFLSAFNSNLQKNPLEFFARNSLNFLFVHFLVLNIMINNNLFYVQSFLVSFSELLLVSSCLILIYEKFKQKSSTT